MDDIHYIIIIILLTVFTFYYGGHNNQSKLEYTSNYFSNLDRIILFENKLQKFNTDANFNSKDYINIKEHIKSCHTIIPNLVDLFFIKINPNSIYKINKIFNIKNIDEYSMLVFNHNKEKHINLELLVDHTNTSGYFYPLKKNISLVKIFDIYNSSNKEINLTIFFIKKPFWYE